VSRTKNPKKLSIVVDDICQVLGITEAYHQYKTLQIWHSVVGEAVSSATTIERFSNGELFIRVKSSAWRMELNFRKQDILSKLNAALSDTTVREIIFR